MAGALAVGMLAALPASAGSGLIKVTHASTPYRGASQPVSATPAKAPAGSPEVQVAVMAKSPAQPAQPASRRGVFIRR
jgi:hypothetical protein